MRYWSFMVLIGVILLSSIPLDVVPCSATEVWSDDFDDGNYDDWIVQWGDWIASNNTLQALYHPNTYQNGGLISYPSSTAYGTWGFDFYITPNDKAINFIFSKTYNQADWDNKFLCCESDT